MLDVSTILPFIIAIVFPLFISYLTDWDGDILLICGALSVAILSWSNAIPAGFIVVAILMVALAGYHAFFMDGE